MTKTLEVRSPGKCGRGEKAEKDELFRLMKALDANSRPLRVIRSAGKAARAVPRKRAAGTKLSKETLGLLREYFSICVALRREYNGVEGV